jgi:hypothetical protein
VGSRSATSSCSPDATTSSSERHERGRPGIYNAVDDDPAPVREWLPALASALDAKPPRPVPRWLARLAAGETATAISEGLDPLGMKVADQVEPQRAQQHVAAREAVIEREDVP